MSQPTTVQILTTPQVSASSLFGLYDTLTAAGRDWEALVTGEPETPVFDIQLVGPTLDPFPCGNGLRIAPDVTFDQAGACDLIIVPGLNLSPRDRLNPAEHDGLRWLETRLHREARIVSACTGAIYLAEIGILDGVEATSHWAFSELFRKYYPKVRMRLDRGLCFSNAAEGPVTSGGTTGWQELALFLIANYGDAQRAARAAKVWLMADRGELQSPFTSMTSYTPHSDSAIEALQIWIAENYAVENPVRAMVELSGIPQTSLTRRFVAATGKKPMEYVIAVRIEEARQMLETTESSIADIGEEVGYSDTASFRRLFRRRTGLSPSAHRKMFGAARFRRYAHGGAN